MQHIAKGKICFTYVLLYLSMFYFFFVLLMMNYIFFLLTLPKVQRTLTVPILFNTECEVRPKDVQAAPALSRALARVLNATESKENEREEEHSDTDVEERTKGTKPSGKIWILLKVFVVVMAV